MSEDNQTMTFVYAYWHKASESKGEELRWSMRSIAKYYQGSYEIVIVGSPPPWYQGKSIVIPRIRNKGGMVKFRDQINKLVVACASDLVSDPFIWIMDDCYLNRPIPKREMLFPKHGGHISSGKIRRYGRPSNTWRMTRVCALQILLANNQPTYDFAIHLPQPVHKAKFLQTVSDHNLQQTGVNWEMLYLNQYFSHKGVNAKQWHSVESGKRSISGVRKRAEGKRFLFNRERGFQPGLIEYLRDKLPDPIKEEGSVGVFTSVHYREQLPNLLNHLAATSMVEVGVRDGTNLAKYSTGCSTLEEIHAVDIWKADVPLPQNDNGASEEEVENFYEKFLRIKESDSRIVEHRNFSIEAASDFDDSSIDFVYLDADHTRKGITEDIEAWYPKVKPGGVLAGHDYIDPNHKALRHKCVKFEVKPVVDEFVKTNKLKLHRTQERFGTWMVQKPSLSGTI